MGTRVAELAHGRQHLLRLDPADVLVFGAVDRRRADASR